MVGNSPLWHWDYLGMCVNWNQVWQGVLNFVGSFSSIVLGQAAITAGLAALSNPATAFLAKASITFGMASVVTGGLTIGNSIAQIAEGLAGGNKTPSNPIAETISRATGADSTGVSISMMMAFDYNNPIAATTGIVDQLISFSESPEGQFLANPVILHEFDNDTDTNSPQNPSPVLELQGPSLNLSF
jgi:hypothetical protein